MPPCVVVLGDVVYDLLAEMREPLAFGTDTRAAMHAHPGGAGAHVAAWLARLGITTHFVGRVGQDVFGQALAEQLAQDGVIAHLSVDASRPTGKIVILVDTAGERTMIVDRGATLGLEPGDLPADGFKAGRHLHLSGYSFFDAGPCAVALEALRRARAAGMTVSVDPASASLLERLGPQRFLEWTRGADLCFPNLEEGALLSGAAGPDAVAAALRVHYAHVVLKLGAQGALYVGAGHEPVVLPAEPAHVADTTGAGDAVCAAFLAAWLAGEPPSVALRRGLRLAAQVVQRIGGR